jgi:hypothetical protein
METNYVEEVSSLFQARCGKTILGPEDYAQIAEWQKQEIPIEVVAVTIDLACDILGEECDVNSISFFDEPIRTNYRRWLEMQGRWPPLQPKKGN